MPAKPPPMYAAPTYPQISDARRIGKRYGLPTAIILFELPDGRLGYASYGATRELCPRARQIADAAMEAAEDAAQSRPITTIRNQ